MSTGGVWQLLQYQAGPTVGLVPTSGGILSAKVMARALTGRGIPAVVSSLADLALQEGAAPTLVLLDVDVEHRTDDVAAACEDVRRALPQAKLLLLVARADAVRSLAPCGVDAVVTRDAGLDGLVTALEAVASGRRPSRVAPLVPRQRDEAQRAVASLTAREREVLRLVATGAPNGEVAESLQISPHTVRTHVQNVLAKLGAENRLMAAAMARRAGLLGEGLHGAGHRVEPRR